MPLDTISIANSTTRSSTASAARQAGAAPQSASQPDRAAAITTNADANAAARSHFGG